MVETRLMLPSKRNASPEWEVKLDGTVIGYVHEKKLGGASRPFYEAVGILPNGEQQRLELSNDFDERVALIAAFHRDPLVARQHLPRHVRQSLEGS
jgi:hypothetical protein